METPLFFSEKSESSAQKQHIHSFMEVEKTYSYRMLKEYASECNCVWSVNMVSIKVLRHGEKGWFLVQTVILKKRKVF